MPRFYKPGERRGNTTYVVRGTIKGEPHELRCKYATKRSDAEEEWDAFKRKIREDNDVAQATFGDVADSYIEVRNPSKNDRRHLEKLKEAWIKSRENTFGNLLIREIVQMDIDQAAVVLCPGLEAATKNRQVYTPATTVLHYAADSKLRDWMRVKPLKTKEAETRRPAKGVAEKLIEATEGIQQEFLIFLFLHGWRVTESLKHRWENTDLKTRTFRVYVRKAGKWKTIHMHPEVFVRLAQRAEDEGLVWPWNNREAVYYWLKPLCEKLGVRFTPHMARHEWGSQQNEEGGTVKDHLDGCTWTDPRSVMRYQTPSAEHGRKIVERIKIGAKVGQKLAK